MQNFYILTKGFDTVNYEILLEKLNHFGIRSKENSWFHSFLTNRKPYVSINGFFSQAKIVLSGVPQGSTLGPLLFLFYINDHKGYLHYKTITSQNVSSEAQIKNFFIS